MKPFGRYDLEGKIAQGGMGEIFRATQRGPGGFERSVALKLLIPHLAADPSLKEMFLHEAKIAAGLSHPNICQIIDVGIEQGRHFIAMEYLSGQTLARAAKVSRTHGQRLPLALSAYIVARAADALAHAHEKTNASGLPLQIVHRDVSPRNIMITYDGQVKLLDFGIARIATQSGSTQTGMIRGTVSYMSPEQVKGTSLDARSDLFSLGIILYELISNQSLFKNESDFVTMQNIVSQTIPPFPDDANVPPELAQVVDRALARNRDQRLSSAKELSRLLNNAIKSMTPVPSNELLARYMEMLFPSDLRAEMEAMAQGGEGTSSKSSDDGPAPFDASTILQKKPGTRALVSPAPTSNNKKAAYVALAIGVVAAAGAVAMMRTRSPLPNVSEPPKQERRIVAEVPAPVSAPVETAPTPVAPAPPVVVPVVSKPRSTRTPKVVTATAPAARIERGRLTLDTSPWTEVFLGTRTLGVTPLVDVQLPTGHHRLRAINKTAKVDRVIEVDIEPNQTTRQRLQW